MATLQVFHFSCIENAEITLSDMTILIGPQASGKSVLSKLFYFCYTLLSKQFNHIREEAPFSTFLESVEADFRRWFPEEAWGESRFQIIFSTGPIEMHISRVTSTSKRSKNLRVHFSDVFVTKYESVLKAYSEALAKRVPSSKETVANVSSKFDILFPLQRAVQETYKRELGRDFTLWQLFIPAGRSFFTSHGKAAQTFEHAGTIDPATLQFGRTISSIRDHRSRLPHLRPNGGMRNRSTMKELFDGEIKIEKDGEYLACNDGRRIPLSFMSSGQQELFPLWLALQMFPFQENAPGLVFIEEPEAHLFPAAQSSLAKYLASLITANSGARMMITTHSPYILATFNNLIKAGQLAGKSSDLDKKLTEIIPKSSWLERGMTSAYSIEDRKTKSIVDDDGLVHAEYLDRVSGEIAEEYNALLELEYSPHHA